MEVEMGISAVHKRCCMHKPMGIGFLNFGKYQTSYSTCRIPEAMGRGALGMLSKIPGSGSSVLGDKPDKVRNWQAYSY